jgi:hypothetical protein
MTLGWRLSACVVIGMLIAKTAVSAQSTTQSLSI